MTTRVTNLLTTFNSRQNVIFMLAMGIESRTYVNSRGESLLSPREFDSSTFDSHSKHEKTVVNIRKALNQLLDKSLWLMSKYALFIRQGAK